mmetsp:Transcript_2247/g.3067  ORF Transcript_2247/g.3067 Transcript_2247/m.3067 type:complete len:102 (-) Transcript_2247:97-402(-)|eukprot:CAMPEP_0185619700 /NCGR_PEP_ID=MMETSP0436-20130131/51446_1 /TAXON_ID=626734 ORGANISM="Favella taraikaensis, Strain Fe Narragansett Bay" /NCGR_SAMPLE_ID=MMETSP0436 /ASSEMBLY_ACC=CAM_ASM_000390 /LENGTH=101 /DNA_ID=CAMNT_0028259407 /DNA_START=624 /DNA_END=925 /DNA_ORIENTATION=-
MQPVESLDSPEIDQKGATSLMPDQSSLGSPRSSYKGSVGRYTIGTFLGEEWIFFKKYTQREETCIALEPSCVLEITVESFESIRKSMMDRRQSKDISMLEA